MPSHADSVRLAWAAGLFEGEGCIAAPAKSPHQFHLMVISADLDVLMKFADIVGCGTILEKPRPANKPHWSDTWVWQAFGDSAEFTLRSMLRHLCGRRFARACEALKIRDEYRQSVMRERSCHICGNPFRPRFTPNSAKSFLC